MKKFFLLFLLTLMSNFAFAAININTASKEELMTLKGIGPVKAQAIISHRPFKSLDELDKIPGFGPKLLSNIKDNITITGGMGQQMRDKMKSMTPDEKAAMKKQMQEKMHDKMNNYKNKMQASPMGQ